ncbi:MAG: alpha/beta hydrolase [Chloroflexi bacterium]|nr:alpha/beta hydrolase [Chloroflexota bacterium]
MMRFKMMVVFILLGLTLCLPACGGTSETPTATLAPTSVPGPTRTPELVSSPRFDQAACSFVLPEGYVQGENVTCGYLVVPEDRSQLPSRAIRLAVGIFHPKGGAANPDPVIYLSGGPGGSALEFIRYQFDDHFAPVLETMQRDLIVFDQRGVGRSKPALDCPNFNDLSLELLDGEMDGQQISDEQVSALAMGALQTCAANLGQIADLSAYNSASNADDVRDLRLALGYEQVNLWGVSYGTRLALTVMRDYPEGARSVVLDSVYPPDVNLYLEGPANFGRSLDLLLDNCAANPICGANFPNLRAVFFDTVERLNAHPASSTITNTLTGEAHAATMSGDAFMGFVFQVLYETEFKYMLPQFIYDASGNDFVAIDRIRGAILAQRMVLSRGMTFSVQCNEEVPFSSLAEYERTLARYPELVGLYEYSIMGKLVYQVCDVWDSGQALAIENQPVASDIPTLVMVGEFDPVTPPAWGERAAETLTHGYFFEYPGVGHGVSAEDCGREMMLAFLGNPAVVPDDDCIVSKDLAGLGG